MVALPRIAHADPPAHADHSPAPRDPRRPLPDYDNRPPAPPTAGEVAAWIPRVLLFPLYAITEYGIRAPTGYITTAIERSHVIDRINAVMHPLPNLAITPSLVVDLGLVTSGGLHLRWSEAGVRGNTVRLLAATGGAHYWRLGFTDTFSLGTRANLGITVTYNQRNDWRYYGLGPLTFQTDEQRFNWSRTDVRLFFEWATLHHFGVNAAGGVRYDNFDMSDPALTLPQNPPGYDDHGTFYGEAMVFADTRHIDAPRSTGARIEGRVMAAADTRIATERQWVGGEVEGSLFLEVKHPGRVLGIRTYAAMVHPLSTRPVPFVDLPTLGGFETMQGFYWGRFRGQSAAVMTAEYRYPVWYYLDGMLFAEVGNAFGRDFEGFDFRHLYGSAGFGFRTTGDRDLSFHGLLAFGSSRFDEPFEIRSVHVAFGINRGF